MGFAERGWEVRALAPQGPLARTLTPYCAEIRALPCGPFASASKTVSDAMRFAWQLPRQAAMIARMAARNHVDVIYVNGPRVLPAAALGRAGRPLIYHSHWMVPQRSAASLARAALRRSGASAIATSRLAGEWLQDSVKPSRVSTIYNGVAGFGISPRPRDAVRHIAIVGRVSPEKGQLEFVRAARIAVEQIRGLRFTVCGAPMFTEERYFEQVRAEAAGLPVEFSGWTRKHRRPAGRSRPAGGSIESYRQYSASDPGSLRGGGARARLRVGSDPGAGPAWGDRPFASPADSGSAG